MNTWEEADRSLVDVMQCEPPPLLFHPDDTPTDQDESNAPAVDWMCNFFLLVRPFLLVRSAQFTPRGSARLKKALIAQSESVSSISTKEDATQAYARGKSHIALLRRIGHAVSNRR